MKFLRILFGLVLVVILATAAFAALVAHNQQKIVRQVLDQIQARGGVTITIAASHFAFRSHLVVVIDHPRVTREGRELFQSDSLQAYVSYHSILSRAGLPLYALILRQPHFVLPAETLGVHQVSPPGADLPGEILALVDRLTAVTRRVEATGAEVQVPGAKPSQFDLFAYHRRLHPHLWMVNFDSTVNLPHAEGIKFAGSFSAGSERSTLSGSRDAANGRLWAWDVPLDALDFQGVRPAGIGTAAVEFAVAPDGDISGKADLIARAVKLAGQRFNSPLDVGDLSLDTKFALAQDKASLDDAKLARGQAQIASGHIDVANPYDNEMTIEAGFTGIDAQIPSLVRIARTLRDFPGGIESQLEAIHEGRLKVESVALSYTPHAKRSLKSQLISGLSFKAILSDVGVSLPKNWRLPDIDGFAAQVVLSEGLLNVSQASGSLGNSSASDLALQANLGGGIDRVPYKMTLKGKIDADEGYRAVAPRLPGAAPNPDQVRDVTGSIAVEGDAAGWFDHADPQLPVDYHLQISPLHCEAFIKGVARPISLIAGAIKLSPGVAEFQRFTASSGSGSAEVDGEVAFGNGPPTVHKLQVDLHRIPAEEWLPLALDRDKLFAQGPLGGSLMINSRSGSHMASVSGKVTMGPGKISFGFLRSPIVVQTAILDLDGRGLTLATPGATVEGSPIDFKLTVADLEKPQMRIDTSVQSLDLHVMKFMRFPWEPPTPVNIFAVPVLGHVEAKTAVMGKLNISDLETDFLYDHGDWRVYNLTTTAFNGQAQLDITGRRKDDWVKIDGSLSKIDIASLLILTSKRPRPVLTGQLFATAHLWADTHNDFFETLSGTLNFIDKDGRIDRFTLLTRMLSMIDLKNWLTGNVPDPRNAGLPLNFLSADFAGEDGVLYTDDLRLDGPVMDILASGNVNVATDYMQMQVGLLPFNTVNWLVSKIPLIGGHVSQGTAGLVAAYFEVHGPVDDPHVTPMPITSIAELVKKTLGIPINVIRPNTVK